MIKNLLKTISCLFSFSILLAPALSFSQTKDTIGTKALLAKIPETIKFSGYVDAFYAYSSDSMGVNQFQKFPNVSPKNNQFGINIFQLSAQYTAEKVRATATIHYGDLPSGAWSTDYNIIQEANAGFRLTKKLWIDAGLFKTHIGTELLLPRDNITSSVAVVTYYEPWWQAGVRLTYTPSDKLLITLHILNGYNTFVENNKSKSYGLGVSYALGEKGNINYYNLIGDDSPDAAETKHLRFLNNVVFNYEFTKKFKTTIGVDYITQQHSSLSDTTQSAAAFSAILTLKYQLKPRFAIYARGETFSDKNGFLTGVITDAKNKQTGYVVNGATVGVEFKPAENAYLRFEARDLMMENNQKIFHTDGANTNSRIEAMVHLGVWF